MLKNFNEVYPRPKKSPALRGIKLVAERQGFEPWDPGKGVNGFRDRPIRPLWHLSNCLGLQK